MHNFFAGKIWAMEPAALQSMLERAEYLDMSKSTPQAARPYAVEQGIAKIELRGALIEGLPEFFAALGVGTNPEHVAAQIAQADTDPEVVDMQIIVDSPGGTASAGPIVDAAIQAADKPVEALVSGIAASAAVWSIASADKITAASKMAKIGSIGAYSVLTDSSEAAEKAGIKRHLIASNEQKGAGEPGVPLSAEQIAAAKELVDQAAEYFVADLSAGRPELMPEALSGKMFFAEKALELGLIDDIHTAETPAKSTTQEANTMSKTEQAAAPVATAEVEALKAQVAALTEKNGELAELAQKNLELQALQEQRIQAMEAKIKMERGEALIAQAQAKGLKDKHFHDAEGNATPLKELAFSDAEKFAWFANQLAAAEVKLPERAEGHDGTEVDMASPQVQLAKIQELVDSGMSRIDATLKVTKGE